MKYWLVNGGPKVSWLMKWFLYRFGYAPEIKHRYQKLPFFKGVGLFQTIILGIHVSFRECTWVFFSDDFHRSHSQNPPKISMGFTLGLVKKVGYIFLWSSRSIFLTNPQLPLYEVTGSLVPKCSQIYVSGKYVAVHVQIEIYFLP